VDLIEGIVVKKLKVIPDDRGYLMEMMRRDWPEFMQFAVLHDCLLPWCLQSLALSQKTVRSFCMSLGHVQGSTV